MHSLTGQGAIVTGAAGGIGAATARLLAQRGAGLVLVDLAEERLAAVATSIREEGGRALALAGDVTDEALGPRAVEAALGEYGRLDILVNNAGVGSAMQPIWEIDVATWRRDLEINLTSMFQLCRAAVPVMRERGYGRIVNVASAAGMEGHALAGGYAAAKAGVVALTKTLGKELAPDGVLVNAIAPALISSEMLAADWFDEDVKQRLLERIPMGRMGEPEEVAEMIAFLAGPAVTFSTGAVFDLSGGRATY